MKDHLSRYTLRVEQELLDKFGYIADFEKEYGRIE